MDTNHRVRVKRAHDILSFLKKANLELFRRFTNVNYYSYFARIRHHLSQPPLMLNVEMWVSLLIISLSLGSIQFLNLEGVANWFLWKDKAGVKTAGEEAWRGK